MSTSQSKSPRNRDLGQLMSNIENQIELLASKSQSNHRQKILETKGQLQQGLQVEIDFPMQQFEKKLKHLISSHSKKGEHPAELHVDRTVADKRMQLSDLETSAQQINPNNPQGELSLSRHVKQFTESSLRSCSASKSVGMAAKLDEMEQYYIEEIRSLSYRVSYLEQENDEKTQESRSLKQELENYKSLYERKQEDVSQEMEAKLGFMKEQLIQKFSEECRVKYTEYVEELKELTDLLSLQRSKRRNFEDLYKAAKHEKNTLEAMHKKLMHQQKQMLILDMDRTKQEISEAHSLSLHSREVTNQQISPNLEEVLYQTGEKPPREQVIRKEKVNRLKSSIVAETQLQSHSGERRAKSNSRTKSQHNQNLTKSRSNKNSSFTKSPSLRSKKRKGQNDHRKNKSTHQMSKEQLIPFLAKGIEELKQKLNMAQPDSH